MNLQQFVKIKLNEGLYAYGNIGAFLGNVVKVVLVYPNPGGMAMYDIKAIKAVRNIDRFLYL